MKAVVIALVFFLFNLMMGMVVHSELFPAAPHYESDYLEKYGGYINSTNLTARTAEQQTTISYDIMGVIGSLLSFNWVYQYIPDSLTAYFSPVIMGFNILLGIIYTIAFIEIFVQRDILGGGE